MDQENPEEGKISIKYAMAEVEENPPPVIKVILALALTGLIIWNLSLTDFVNAPAPVLVGAIIPLVIFLCTAVSLFNSESTPMILLAITIILLIIRFIAFFYIDWGIHRNLIMRLNIFRFLNLALAIAAFSSVRKWRRSELQKSVTVKCPECQFQSNLGVSHLGQKVKCNNCQEQYYCLD